MSTTSMKHATYYYIEMMYCITFITWKVTTRLNRTRIQTVLLLTHDYLVGLNMFTPPIF